MKIKFLFLMLLIALTFICKAENENNFNDSLTNKDLPSLGTILNPDGTLNLSTDMRGSFNPMGYQMISESGKAPRFIPSACPGLKMAGDEYWDNPFAQTAFSNNPSGIWAILVNGTSVYVGGNITSVAGIPEASGIAKWDGSKWSALGTGITGGNVYALALLGTDIIVGGSFTWAGGVPVSYVAKWNGTAWSALNGGVGSQVWALTVSGTNLYAGGQFTTVNGNTTPANYIGMWNGTTWSALGTGTNGRVRAIAISGTTIYAGGNFTLAGGVVNTSHIAKWNGTAWSALSTGLNANVYAIAINGTDIYAGGDFTDAGGLANADHIARFNGTSWFALGVGADGAVDAIHLNGTDVYIGGYFTTAGGITTNNVAKWNGSTWSAIGNGVNDNVLALEMSGSDLYVGGYFTDAGGDPTADALAEWTAGAWKSFPVGAQSVVWSIAIDDTNIYVGGDFTKMAGVSNTCRIAKWDGHQWTALGTGLNADVRAIEIFGGDVYAGGDFTDAGGVASADYIAKWDGATWSALGTGLNQLVNCLKKNGSFLYVGGNFTSAGGVANANFIARWNGANWSALSATPLNGSVTAITFYNNVLYAGGYFINAGGLSNADYIVKWSGGIWSAVSSAPIQNGNVNAIAVDASGVYAGGSIWFTGNPNLDNIAKWNGTSWVSLGTGLDGYVYSLVIKDNDLYAGGGFSDAGGVTAPGIAKWENNTWSTLGSGVNSFSLVIATDSNYLYTGGLFTTAGAKLSLYLARYGVLPNITSGPTPQISCQGDSVVFTVLSTGSATKAFQWKHNGAVIPGANDSILIIHPVGISDQGYYKCTVNNPCGSVNSDSSLLTVHPSPVVTIVGDLDFCTGDSVYLQATGPIHTASWSDGSIAIGIYVNQPGDYFMTAMDTVYGCWGASDTITVSEHPLPPVTVNAQNDSICLNSSTSLIASGANTYTWAPATGLSSTTGSTVTANPTITTSYIVTGIETANGCQNTASITLNVLQPYASEIICEVNVDTIIGKNFIVWEKTPNVGTESFIIYKEGIVGGVYNPVDTIPYDSLSVYTDMSSDAMVKSDRYKISVLDTCGNESAQSPAHKTLHLTVNMGMGGAINLIWENYEGFVFGSYFIYRGPTTHTLQPIDTIPNTITTYTDLAPPVGLNYYLIVIDKTDSCIASSSAKDQTETYNTSVSNMEEYQILSSAEIGNLPGFEVFPNPAQNTLFIKNINSDALIKIFDVNGRLVFIGNANSGKINISSLTKGVYCLEVIQDNGVGVKRFMKE